MGSWRVFLIVFFIILLVGVGLIAVDMLIHA
jgi:hypothetical protein